MIYVVRQSKVANSILQSAFLAIPQFVPRQLRSLYFTCSELLRRIMGLRIPIHVARARAVRHIYTCIRVYVARIYAPAYVCILYVCVTESLMLGAHGSHNAVYGHYGHCATRERMNMCTMHQRVKTQWRTTHTPELRRQSA